VEHLSVSTKALVEIAMKAKVADEENLDLCISTMEKLKTARTNCIKHVASVRQLAEWSQVQLAEVGQIYEAFRCAYESKRDPSSAEEGLGSGGPVDGSGSKDGNLYTDPAFLVEIGDRSLRKLQAQRRAHTVPKVFLMH
jgi:hypothetical protein